MDLGVLIEGEAGLTWDRWRRIVASVEALGYESLWRSDHLLSLLDDGRESLETWVALTLAAAETTRLRFGPLVCPMTFRHPSLLAKMAADVDALSGGRLILGVGAGWNECEHRAFGIPFPPLRERMEMLEEGIEVIVRLLGVEPAHFSGRHYRLAGANLRPQAGQRSRIPLLIGGGGERRTLRMVARYADEWDVPGDLTPAAYCAKSARLTEYCRAINRDPGEIRRGVSTAYLIGRNESELRRRSQVLQQLLPSLAAVDTSAVPETLRTSGWRVGTPDQIAADLRALAAEGVQRVILLHYDQTDYEALELVAREVMPAIAGSP
jgi:F420-dependent oxidoreductase-like protein